MSLCGIFCRSPKGSEDKRKVYQFTEEEHQDIEKIIQEVNKKHHGQIKFGEIRPTNLAPILLLDDNKICADALMWGFPNFKKKGVIINVRSETVLEKPMFRGGFLGRRCVIPTTGFFEWATHKKKYVFTNQNDTLTYLSGLYNEFHGERRYIILTTAANDSVCAIHNRMPIILENNHLYSNKIHHMILMLSF